MILIEIRFAVYFLYFYEYLWSHIVLRMILYCDKMVSVLYSKSALLPRVWTSNGRHCDGVVYGKNERDMVKGRGSNGGK